MLGTSSFASAPFATLPYGAIVYTTSIVEDVGAVIDSTTRVRARRDNVVVWH